MNVDMSAAPEIAVLAGIPAQVSGAAPDPRPARPTIGELARELRLIAASPERWWGLVTFSTCHSEEKDFDLPARQRRFTAWVTILAPGDPGRYCDCDLMMLVTGEAAEESVADGGAVTTALRPGRTRVHGQGQVHQIRACGSGYAVSLHVRGVALR